jgi:hypothetical protein
VIWKDVLLSSLYDEQNGTRNNLRSASVPRDRQCNRHDRQRGCIDSLPKRLSRIAPWFTPIRTCQCVHVSLGAMLRWRRCRRSDLPDSNFHGQDRWMHATLWLLRSLGRLGKVDQNCLPVVLDCCIGLRGEVHAHSGPIVDTHDAKNPMRQYSRKNADSSSNC